MKLFRLCLFFIVLACDSAFALPTISDLKVTSIEPLGLAIDYTVSGAESNDVWRSLEVTLGSGYSTRVARTLVGATNCVNGAHRVYWNMAADGLTIDTTKAILTVAYKLCEGARYCVVDLALGKYSPSFIVTYLNTLPSDDSDVRGYKRRKLVLKRVDPGSFIMGKDQTSEAHRVTLTKPFYMGIYEVTQGQWSNVDGLNPCASTEYGGGAEYPVHYVSYTAISWYSDSFMGRLRAKTGDRFFSLPTEAQWEYTCRAGTTTPWSFGDDYLSGYPYMWFRLTDKVNAHS